MDYILLLNRFGDYVEPKIKYTTYTAKSASYIDILFEIDNGGS